MVLSRIQNETELLNRWSETLEVKHHKLITGQGSNYYQAAEGLELNRLKLD